jgi:hypothetical protein
VKLHFDLAETTIPTNESSCGVKTIIRRKVLLLSKERVEHNKENKANLYEAT